MGGSGITPKDRIGMVYHVPRIEGDTTLKRGQSPIGLGISNDQSRRVYKYLSTAQPTA